MSSKKSHGHKTKKRVCSGWWPLESGATPMGVSEAAAAVGRGILKTLSQPGKTERIARILSTCKKSRRK